MSHSLHTTKHTSHPQSHVHHHQKGSDGGATTATNSTVNATPTTNNGNVNPSPTGTASLTSNQTTAQAQEQQNKTTSLLDEKWTERFGLRVLLPIQLPIDNLFFLCTILRHSVTLHGLGTSGGNNSNSNSNQINLNTFFDNNSTTATHATNSNAIALQVARDVKLAADFLLGGSWHCIIGRDFGSLVTHVSHSFLFVSHSGSYFLIFRCGPPKSFQSMDMNQQSNTNNNNNNSHHNTITMLPESTQNCLKITLKEMDEWMNKKNPHEDHDSHGDDSLRHDDSDDEGHHQH